MDNEIKTEGVAFELISFALCPYVQRSVITLKHKKIDFKITYIDLFNPPEWFDKISPLGQVPVLRVFENPGTQEENETVIFESAVINELIDELNPPSLHHVDPITKARERAWIEYGSSLLGDQYALTTEQDRAKAQELKTEFFASLARLEPVLGNGPFFRGKDFSLVDTAYAPIFTRLFLIEALKNDSAWKKMPKVRAWAEALVRLPEVKDSVLPDFDKSFVEFLKSRESAWTT